MKNIIISLIAVCTLHLPVIAQQSEKIYLSGRDSAHTIKWDFKVSDGMNAGQWSKLPVPSCWEQHGFGTYNYGSDRNYAKGKSPRSEKGLVCGSGKTKSREVGFYKRSFVTPAGWKEKRIFIVFEGVMTDAEVTINGKTAGPVHQGAFYRFKYDISDLLSVPGKNNTLEVKVSKMSSDFSVNMAERQADYWVFGGIFRPVYLEAVPQQYLERFAVDARADGSLTVFTYPKAVKEKLQIKAMLLDKSGSRVGNPMTASVSNRVDEVKLSGRFENIALWSAENPNLYELQVMLMKNGSPLHTLSSKIGFRTFEVKKNDGIYLNGKKIQMRGCCRHSFRPATARALSIDDCLEDVKLLKEMNMNAVRMSHYPPDTWFLDLCDEYGIYVLDELAGWHKPSYDTEIGAKLLKAMVTRDVNHPSILFWDNGNEGGWNTKLDDTFALYDPQNRHIIHPWATFRGFDTSHYRPYKFLKGHLDNNLYMPTEIIHGQYDAGIGAGAEDYWNCIYKHPHGCGMFFWDFADEAIARSDRGGELDTNLPAKGILPVENRFNFNNLNQCRFQWELVRLPLPGQSVTDEKITAEGSLKGPDIQPAENGTIKIPFTESEAAAADMLRITTYTPEGRRILTSSYKLHSNKVSADRLIADSDNSTELNLSQDTAEIRVNVGIFTFVFSKNDGTLTKVIRGGITIPFGKGPFLTASTGKENTPFSVAAATNCTVEITKKSDRIILNIKNSPAFNKLQWTINTSGWLNLNYSYKFKGSVNYMGISFRYPESGMLGMDWRGKGPYRVWKNREKGPQYGVWSNLYNSFKPNTAWNYPEFPGYYADFNWVRFTTADGAITAVTKTENLYFRAYSQPGYSGKTRFIWPQGDISFLHVIPAIGSKFQDSQNLGPRALRINADGEYSADLHFYFGTP